LINPLASERNFTPTFTGELLIKGVAGVAALLQIDPPDDAGAIVMEQLAVMELLEASTTLPVKLKVPVPVDVPAIVPSPVFRFSPPGKDPETIEYVYGLTPPLAASPELYMVPARPLLAGQANASASPPEDVNVTSTQ